MQIYARLFSAFLNKSFCAARHEWKRIGGVHSRRRCRARVIAGAKFHADDVARAHPTRLIQFSAGCFCFFRFARRRSRAWARLRVAFSQKEVRGPLTQRPKRFRQLVTSANESARCVPMRLSSLTFCSTYLSLSRCARVTSNGQLHDELKFRARLSSLDSRASARLALGRRSVIDRPREPRRIILDHPEIPRRVLRVPRDAPALNRARARALGGISWRETERTRRDEQPHRAVQDLRLRSASERGSGRGMERILRSSPDDVPRGGTRHLRPVAQEEKLARRVRSGRRRS